MGFGLISDLKFQLEFKLGIFCCAIPLQFYSYLILISFLYHSERMKDRKKGNKVKDKVNSYKIRKGKKINNKRDRSGENNEDKKKDKK